MAKSLNTLHWPVYLRWMVTTGCVVVAMVGGFNFAIDPLGVFDTPRITNLNAVKPYLDHHRELARSRAARRSCASAGIFGNSRAEIGLDPANPGFSRHDLSAFNHAIPGSSLSLAYQQIGWLKSVGCMPKTIILGVEFFDFLGGSLPKIPTHQEYEPPPRIDARFFAEAVFSMSALRDSVDTVLMQQRRYPAILTERGFNPLYNYIPEVAQNGHYTLFRQRLEENSRNWGRKIPRLRPIGGGESDDERVFKAILDKLSIDKPTTYVIIYPYHAQIRVLIERLGLNQLFADWKRLIVGIAMQHKEKGDNIEVWDFSGVAPETLELMPARGDLQTHLSFYWEAGHFKKALGDRIIARILDREGEFGVKLDSRNIDNWLLDDRARLEALLSAAPPWIREVDDVLSHKTNN